MKISERIRRSAGTWLVLAALGGIAAYGHRTGWTMPRAGLLSGLGLGADEDWCPSHRVPRSRCIACNPALVGADPKDWCREHGVPESECPFCHPDGVKGHVADWCGEHGVPESQCTICHPELAARSGPAPAADPRVEADAAPAGENDPRSCRLHLLRIQFASPESVKKAGIRLEDVREAPMDATVEASGEVEYDAARVARVSSRAAGIVRRALKGLGEPVKKGDVLLLVDAPEIGRARLDLLQMLAATEGREAARKRIESSTGYGFRTAGELEEARAAERESRIRLLAAREALAALGVGVRLEDLLGVPEERLIERVVRLGLPPAVEASLDGPPTANLLPVASPLDGVITSRDAVAGEAVEPGKPIVTVADPSVLGVAVEVPLEAARGIETGQPVLFRPDGADVAVSGKVAWISTAADEKTRTVRVRASVPNADGKLRAGAFGTARIAVREKAKAIAVPTEAIQWEGCSSVVFVRVSDVVFRPRKIRTGIRSGPYTEVIAGLVPGEVVATAGSQILRSELLRGKLGAGCAGE